MDTGVLIPTGREMKSYACMRSLHRRGIDTVVASEFEHIPHFASRYCSEQVRLPSPWLDALDYRDALLDIARRPEIETIVPVRECDTYLLARYDDLFEPYVAIQTPDIETLENGHDRLQLAESAQEAGVPVAETRRLSAVSSWDRNVVIKSRYNILTDAYLDAQPADSLREIKDIWYVQPGDKPDVASIQRQVGHDPIVQAYVPQSKKHLYCALWDQGEPLVTYQHEQIRQNSWVGGGGIYRVSAYSTRVDTLAEKLLRQLDWSGLACIEYLKDDRTGEWKFLEINPRVWQSMPEALRAGVDFPYHYWQTATGDGSHIESDYAAGVGCHNAYGELSHLLSIFRDRSPFAESPSFGSTLLDVVASCARTPRFEYIRRDDPKLFVSALREALLSGVTRSRQYMNGTGPSPSDAEATVSTEELELDD